MIGLARGGENFRPSILGIAEHRGHELTCRVAWSARGDWRSLIGSLRSRPAAGDNLRAVEECAWINTEVPADQANDNDCADT